MTVELTETEKAEIQEKIASEGFDYYFNDYGPDRKLEDLFEKEIEAYVTSRKSLASALIRAGIDLDL